MVMGFLVNGSFVVGEPTPPPLAISNALYDQLHTQQ